MNYSKQFIHALCLKEFYIITELWKTNQKFSSFFFLCSISENFTWKCWVVLYHEILFVSFTTMSKFTKNSCKPYLNFYTEITFAIKLVCIILNYLIPKGSSKTFIIFFIINFHSPVICFNLYYLLPPEKEVTFEMEKLFQITGKA